MTFYYAIRYFTALAVPMIISNIFTPLVGLVDTAIVGHLPGTHFLAGVALGGIIITQLIWVCGFLRMSSTGLSAQASGRDNSEEAASILNNGILLALLLGVLIWLLSPVLFQLGKYFSGSNPQVVSVAQAYFYIRVFAAPVSLTNLVLMGWLLGRKQHSKVMWIQLIANLLNIVLSLLLAIGLSMHVTGVALATVISECVILVLSLKWIAKIFPQWRHHIRLCQNKVKAFLSLNRDVFLRNVFLQLFLAIFTFMGLQLGELTAATNALLMQFFVLIALGLDGVAYAAEALFGEAIGKQQRYKARQWTHISLLVSTAFAVLYTGIFWGFFYEISQLLTNITTVIQNLQAFKVYIVLLPLIAHWSFLLDGLYVGMTRAKPMFVTMVISVVLAICWQLLHLDTMSATVLWQSFMIFLLARGLLLGTHFYYRIYRPS